MNDDTKKYWVLPKFGTDNTRGQEDLRCRAVVFAMSEKHPEDDFTGIPQMRRALVYLRFLCGLYDELSDDDETPQAHLPGGEEGAELS